MSDINTWIVDPRNATPRRAGGGGTTLTPGAYAAKVAEFTREAKKSNASEYNTKIIVTLTEPGFEGVKRTVQLPDPSPNNKDGGEFARGRQVNALISMGLATREQLASATTPIQIGPQHLLSKDCFVIVWEEEDNRPEFAGVMRERLDFCDSQEYQSNRVSLSNGAVAGAATGMTGGAAALPQTPVGTPVATSAALPVAETPAAGAAPAGGAASISQLLGQ